jgi:hypothetical protein
MLEINKIELPIYERVNLCSVFTVRTLEVNSRFYSYSIIPYPSDCCSVRYLEGDLAILPPSFTP